MRWGYWYYQNVPPLPSTVPFSVDSTAVDLHSARVSLKQGVCEQGTCDFTLLEFETDICDVGIQCANAASLK